LKTSCETLRIRNETHSILNFNPIMRRQHKSLDSDSWILCCTMYLQDSLVICRLKRNTEFRLSDHSNRASSSQRHPVNSHESGCAISEGGGIDQRDVCEQDKEVGCSSKRSSSSYGSPSNEQIDSVSESNHRPVNEATLTASSDQPKVHIYIYY